MAQKGHSPVRHLTNGNLQYICPLPDHAEAKPSFIVYTNDAYENFYCFGCRYKYHIIHLVSRLEGISFRTAVEKLGDGIEISTEDELLMVLKRIDQEYQKKKPEMDLSQTMLSINSLCRCHLQGVDYDKVEYGIIQKLWSSVDSCLLDFKFDDINEILKHLPNMLVLRHRKYNKIQSDKKKKQYVGGNDT